MLPPKEEAEADSTLFSDLGGGNCTEDNNNTLSTQKLLHGFDIDFSKVKDPNNNIQTNPFLDEDDLQVQVQLLGDEEESVHGVVRDPAEIRRKFSDSSEPSSSHSGSSPCPSSPVDNESPESDTNLVVFDGPDNDVSCLGFKTPELQNQPDFIINSTMDSSVASSSQGDILSVLQNLENIKTPEPVDMQDSIVRASFVDFSVDDENDGRKSGNSQVNGIGVVSNGTGTGNGLPLEEECVAEDEDSKEFSLSLNPDLPKIRQQQIRNWLEFERENENPETENPHAKLIADLINNNGKDGIGGSDFDLDSLSSHPGDHTVTDADGLQRRVRFLTDPQGNILISVFLTKLVQFILTILKLATVGYLDFTSPAPAPSHSLSTNFSPPPEDFNHPSADTTTDTDTDTLSSSRSSSACYTIIYDYETDYETDANQPTIDNYNDSADGEDEQHQQVIQVANIENGIPNGMTIPEIIENQLGLQIAPAVVTDKKELGESETVSKLEDCKLNINEEIINTDSEKKEVVGDGKKLRITADPSLTSFDDGDDGGSDSETMSTSSCSSMIEVIPKEKTGENETPIEFVKNQELDENNNEIKSDIINLMDAEPIQMKPVEKQDTVEINAKMDHLNQQEKIPDPIEEEPVIVTSGEVTISGSSHIQEPLESSGVAVEKTKFKPTLVEIEMKHDVKPQQSPPVGKVEPEVLHPENIQSPIPTAPPNYDEAVDTNTTDPEQQLVSLPISEEPISAVALTIAKWEKFSKLQQQQTDAGGVNTIAVKGLGKLILPSYTNNAPMPPPVIKVANGQCPSNQIINGAGGKTMNGSNGTPTNGKITPIKDNCNGNNNGATINYKNVLNNKGPDWNNWANGTKLNEKVPISAEEEEAIYSQPNGQGGSLATNLANPSNLLKSFPKPNSRGEIINWFKEGEIHRSGILLSYGQTNHHTASVQLQSDASPVIVSWFFGLITRQQAEELLLGQPTGTFLVRISTRIWGYTLSYQSNNKTKHFLISAVNPAVPGTLTAGSETHGKPPPTGKSQLLYPFCPSGRYAFIGTNMTPYTTLSSLIRHHSHAPITKAGDEKLLNPCPGGPKIAGIEFIFKK